MSDEFERGRQQGLREAGIIADRIADELEFSRCQQVATRIRHAIVSALREAQEGKVPESDSGPSSTPRDSAPPAAPPETPTLIDDLDQAALSADFSARQCRAMGNSGGEETLTAFAARLRAAATRCMRWGLCEASPTTPEGSAEG